jgi:hypothetical protein
LCVATRTLSSTVASGGGGSSMPARSECRTRAARVPTGCGSAPGSNSLRPRSGASPASLTPRTDVLLARCRRGARRGRRGSRGAGGGLAAVPPQEVVGAVGHGGRGARRTGRCRTDAAGRVQPLNPRGLPEPAGTRRDRLQQPGDVPGASRRALRPRGLDGAAPLELPHGAPGREVEKMGADRLRSARRLVERRLRIGEEPGAVRLTRVLLDAARVQDEVEPAVGRVRPRIEQVAGAVCGVGRADAVVATAALTATPPATATMERERRQSIFTLDLLGNRLPATRFVIVSCSAVSCGDT